MQSFRNVFEARPCAVGSVQYYKQYDVVTEQIPCDDHEIKSVTKNVFHYRTTNRIMSKDSNLSQGNERLMTKTNILCRASA
jgi:hypothetical protein